MVYLCCKLSNLPDLVISVRPDVILLDRTSLVVLIVVIVQILTKQTLFLFIQRSTNECRSAVTDCCLTMMNCEQEVESDEIGGNETLIPLQGFGFFSACSLEKIQSLFKV